MIANDDSDDSNPLAGIPEVTGGTEVGTDGLVPSSSSGPFDELFASGYIWF